MTKTRWIMKWVLDKDFAIPFGLALLFARFFDNFWSLLGYLHLFWVCFIFCGVVTQAKE